MDILIRTKNKFNIFQQFPTYRINLFSKESIMESTSIMISFLIIGKIVGFFRGIIFARFLGPSEYGIYNLAFFLLPIIISFSVLGIPSACVRYIPLYEKKGMLKHFVSNIFLFTSISGLIITILLIIFSVSVSELIFRSPDQRLIVILLASSVMCYVLNRNLDTIFAGLRIFKMSSFLVFTQEFSYTIFGITLVFYFQRAESAILGNLLSQFFACLLFIFILLKFISNKSDQKLKINETGFYKKIMKYSIWYVFTPLIFTIFRSTDRWMLNFFRGTEDVGIYSAAANISGTILIFSIALGKVLMPNMSNLWERNQKLKAKNMINLALKTNILIFLGGSVLIYLFDKQIIHLLIGTQYDRSINLIGIFLVFYLLNAVWWIIQIYPSLQEKTYILFFVSLLGTSTNIILNYVLIDKFGLHGAVIATTVSFGLMIILLSAINIFSKMKISLSTILVILSILILLINNKITVVLSYIMLLILAVKTTLIFDNEEKKTVTQQLKRLLLSKSNA